MSEPTLFDGQGAAALGSMGRTESKRPDGTPRPPARRNAPETSHLAAASMEEHAPSLRDAVYALLRARGEHGATDQEIQRALQLTSDTEVPRRWELARAGLVVDSGRRRPTVSGRPATVWVAREHVHVGAL